MLGSLQRWPAERRRLRTNGVKHFCSSPWRIPPVQDSPNDHSAGRSGQMRPVDKGLNLEKHADEIGPADVGSNPNPLLPPYFLFPSRKHVHPPQSPPHS